MICNYRKKLPKDWEDLKPSAQQKINEIYTDAANQLINQQVDKEEAELETMIGQKVGRWTILGEFRKGRFLYYECRCDCGTVRNVKANSIRCGRSKSCGCLRRERALDVISKNSKERIETNAAFRTNFHAIERTEPYKNNKSGRKGVYWEKQKGVWRAIIYVQKRSIYLGSYHDIREAIHAREEAEKKYFLPLIEAKRTAERSKL